MYRTGYSYYEFVIVEGRGGKNGVLLAHVSEPIRYGVSLRSESVSYGSGSLDP